MESKKIIYLTSFLVLTLFLIISCKPQDNLIAGRCQHNDGTLTVKTYIDKYEIKGPVPIGITNTPWPVPDTPFKIELEAGEHVGGNTFLQDYEVYVNMYDFNTSDNETQCLSKRCIKTGNYYNPLMLGLINQSLVGNGLNFYEIIKANNQELNNYLPNWDKYSYRYPNTRWIMASEPWFIPKKIKINPCKDTKLKIVLKPYDGAIKVLSKDGKDYDVFIDDYSHTTSEGAIEYNLETLDKDDFIEVEASYSDYRKFIKSYKITPGKIKTIKCSSDDKKKIVKCT